MSNQIIHITIVDDTTADKCYVHCGIEWTSEQDITLINQRIKERFGDRVKLEYFDLAKSTADRPETELQQRIRNENLNLPLLVINGKTRISGEFDIRQLIDAVDAELEMKS